MTSTRRWVVVGAGAAGCVVAARLAGAGQYVVLVEVGGGSIDEVSRGASFFDATARPDLVHPGPFLRGRGVGGSSAINGMVATPGDDAQYRSWGWDDCGEAFGRIMVAAAPAGDDELGPIDRALLAAAADAVKAPLTRRAGRRITAYDAYLANRQDVELRADTPVVAVAFEGARAIGVELTDGGAVEADAIVLAAGALGSPSLLAASGVGGPEVGQHLRNHPALPIDLHLRRGVAGDLHGLVSATLLRRGDLQLLPVNHLGPDVPDRGGFLVMAMAPTGQGRITGSELEPTVQVVLSERDHARLAAGVELVRRLVDAAAFRAIVDDVEIGQPPAGVYHATSTCRMGDVVDADGAVIGTSGLFVVDASIFPDIPRTNTYLPTLMLAERMVGRVLARASHGP